MTNNIDISIVMGSKSDLEIMKYSINILKDFKIKFETLIISAHRTPDLLFDFASKAKERGIKIIIAGAGGAAHLPGMLAAKTLIPVLGVPIPSKYLNGVDSMYSILQMPKGIPVGTLAIGEAGAVNASLLALQILANNDDKLFEQLKQFREKQIQDVLSFSCKSLDFI